MTYIAHYLCNVCYICNCIDGVTNYYCLNCANDEIRKKWANIFFFWWFFCVLVLDLDVVLELYLPLARVVKMTTFNTLFVCIISTFLFSTVIDTNLDCTKFKKRKIFIFFILFYFIFFFLFTFYVFFIAFDFCCCCSWHIQ